MFYPVKEEIIYAESRMKIDFPKELREFFSQIGYGYFYDKDECFIDLLMSPRRIADFRCGEGDYFYVEEREFLKSEDLVFFEIDSNCHIYLKIGGEDGGNVFLGKRKIAQSFGEFIGKISIESNFFLKKDHRC